MKRTSMLLSTLLATLLIGAMPSFATDGNVDTRKDECLLVSMNCNNSVDTILQRIDKLNKEISKGTAVYTSDELMILRNKLEEQKRTLDTLLLDG